MMKIRCRSGANPAFRCIELHSEPERAGEPDAGSGLGARSADLRHRRPLTAELEASVAGGALSKNAFQSVDGRTSMCRVEMLDEPSGDSGADLFTARYNRSTPSLRSSGR